MEEHLFGLSSVKGTKQRGLITKCVMSLGSPVEDENEGFPSKPPPMFDGGFAHQQASVMPAWIAGIQARRMHPDTSMST